MGLDNASAGGRHLAGVTTKKMINKEKLLITAGFGSVSLLLNAALILAIAWPFGCLWNQVLGSLGIPILGYWRAAGVLLLWKIVSGAGKGVTLTAKFRDTD